MFKADPTPRSKRPASKIWHKITQGLYYPAAIGAAVVYLLQSTSTPDTALFTPEHGFALYIVFHFTVSWVINDYFKNDYSSTTFVIDTLDVAIICIALADLGFGGTKDFQQFYLIMILSPILHQIWNWCTSSSISDYLEFLLLSVGRIVVFSAGFLFSVQYPHYHIFALISLIVLSSIHLWRTTVWMNGQKQ